MTRVCRLVSRTTRFGYHASSELRSEHQEFYKVWHSDRVSVYHMLKSYNSASTVCLFELRIVADPDRKESRQPSEERTMSRSENVFAKALLWHVTTFERALFIAVVRW